MLGILLRNSPVRDLLLRQRGSDPVVEHAVRRSRVRAGKVRVHPFERRRLETDGGEATVRPS
ncbi:MAG: hypothetical protein ACRD3V_04345 [Vicinamibacteria bacterium]